MFLALTGRIKNSIHTAIGALMAGMRIVTDQFKILKLEIVDVFHRRIQFHLRQRTRFARELQLRLLNVVA